MKGDLDATRPNSPFGGDGFGRVASKYPRLFFDGKGVMICPNLKIYQMKNGDRSAAIRSILSAIWAASKAQSAESRAY